MAINIEGIKDFIRKHPKPFIAFAAALFACLVVVIVALLAFSSRPAEAENVAAPSKALAISPGEFFFPEEALPLSRVQLSRETAPAWSEEERERWLIPLSKDDMDELRLLGEESVTRLLEQVP